MRLICLKQISLQFMYFILILFRSHALQFEAFINCSQDIISGAWIDHLLKYVILLNAIVEVCSVSICHILYTNSSLFLLFNGGLKTHVTSYFYFSLSSAFFIFIISLFLVFLHAILLDQHFLVLSHSEVRTKTDHHYRSQ
jgi:hypothetical protein